jgi:hypothetical protein
VCLFLLQGLPPQAPSKTSHFFQDNTQRENAKANIPLNEALFVCGIEDSFSWLGGKTFWEIFYVLCFDLCGKSFFEKTDQTRGKKTNGFRKRKRAG